MTCLTSLRPKRRLGDEIPVIITPHAVEDLRSVYRYIRQQAPAAATRWIQGARRRIKTLAHHPQRCPLAPESAAFHQEIRELFYGKGGRGVFRILFVVVEKSPARIDGGTNSMAKLTLLG